MNYTPEQMELFKAHLNAIITNHDAKESLLEHRKILNQTTKKFEKSEKNLKAVQSVGLMIGEILKKMNDEKFIVKSSQGPRYVVGCINNIDRSKLVEGARVALDITTLTIMRVLSREIDPVVFMMAEEKPGDVDFSEIGGLEMQIRELREVVELPLTNPEIFKRVGVVPPKGVLLYGPPGTGKTLLARAVAATLNVNFIKIVSSAIIEKYIGESSRMVREIFSYASERRPCIIFMDEIDAIGGKRSSESSSADREVQRTLMELLAQLDGFKKLEDVKIIMATNRPDILDPALLRPGRLDRKIEIPLPNEQGRIEILKIHSSKMFCKDEIDYETLAKLATGFNGADLRHVCTEAGMLAIRDDRDFVMNDDFIKSVRKIAIGKKLESKIDYKRQ
ncbi:26S proteasome regulatory subunit 10B [Dictyocoela muelleri]|nr:26S proteasome regulatory subunit 10B [Dictyocoela muelleri]